MKKFLIMFTLITLAGVCVSAALPAVKFYRSEKFGFQLEFPASWKDLKVIEKSTDWTPGVKAQTLYFCLPTKVKGYPGEAPGYASIFAITVFTRAQLDVLREYRKKNGEMPGEEIQIFKDNKKYFFSPGQAQDVPDDLYERMREVSKILKTFKLTT